MKKILVSPFLYVVTTAALVVVAYFMDIPEFVGKYPVEVIILAAIFLVGSITIATGIAQFITKATRQEMQVKVDSIKAKYDDSKDEVQKLTRKLQDSERDCDRYKNAYLDLCDVDKEAMMARAAYSTD